MELHASLFLRWAWSGITCGASVGGLAMSNKPQAKKRRYARRRAEKRRARRRAEIERMARAIREA